MANGGIIGPIKVVCTPSTKTTSVTSTGDFVRQNCQVTSVSALVIGGGGGSGHGNSDSFAGAGGAGAGAGAGAGSLIGAGCCAG